MKPVPAERPGRTVRAASKPALRTLLMAALALVLGASTGCVRYVEFYTVTFRSKNGQELAKGEIMLSRPLVADATSNGWYKLEMRHVLPVSKDIDEFYQLFKGKESGRMEWVVPRDWGARPAKFDFMPMSVDANVTASASQAAKGYWRGRWSFVLFSGIYEGGAIEISRKK